MIWRGLYLFKFLVFLPPFLPPTFLFFPFLFHLPLPSSPPSLLPYSPPSSLSSPTSCPPCLTLLFSTMLVSMMMHTMILPHHSPEVRCCVRQRTLRCNVRILLLETLQMSGTQLKGLHKEKRPSHPQALQPRFLDSTLDLCTEPLLAHSKVK